MSQDQSNKLFDNIVNTLDAGEDPLAIKPEVEKPANDKKVVETAGAKFLQQAINQYSKSATKGKGPQLAVDGNAGPKTLKAAQAIIRGLPPEMKRWAVAKLKKAMPKGRG